MEKKILNQTQLGIVRRICQNVYGNFEKVAKLNEKVAAIQEEIAGLQETIDLMEQPVINMCGYKSTDLYERVIVPMFNEDGTPKVNDKGYQIKTTKWVLKYPDTILPVENSEVMEAADNTNDNVVDELEDPGEDDLAVAPEELGNTPWGEIPVEFGSQFNN